ncbi:MAG: hypothetical protein NTV34_02745 [Proteobacteria bacterium]|nr:hypothetical protein [Pseudomonadota bacterium]
MNYKLTKSQKLILESHDVKLSRRNLLGLGVISVGGLVYSRSLLSSIAFGNIAELNFPAFLTIDLVGGAALAGNFLVGGRGGSNDLLPSYSKLGYEPSTAQLDARFGLPSPSDVSGIFKGITQKLSLEAQSLTRITSIAHQSIDDGDQNSTSALALVARYFELNSAFRHKGLSTQGTTSGGNTRLAYDSASLRPEQFTTLDQISQLLKKFIDAQKNEYTRQFDALTSADQISLKDAYEQSMDTYFNSTTPVQLDPRSNKSAQDAFGVLPTAKPTDELAINAGIAYACISGVVGPSCISLGGFDYHDGTQTTGDNRDKVAGELIGSILQLAHLLKKPVFLQVISDGSVVAKEGSRNWTADSVPNSLTLMVSYNPSGPYKQLTTQLGHYNFGQAADSSTYVGKSTRNVGYATLLNYLSAISRESEIGKILSVGEMPTDEIDRNISFTS